MIVKIQRPLFTTEKGELALIYNRDRTFETIVPFEEVEQLFEAGINKVYAHAHLEGTDLHINDWAPDQPW
jgi:hypothetical protein